MALPNQLKLMQRAKSMAEVKELNKEVRRLVDAKTKDFELRTGLKLNKLVRGPYVSLPSFTGSWKVPMAIVRLMLSGHGTDPALSVADRHSLLLPMALRELGVRDETLSASVWYQELQDYQLEPIQALLKDRGYKPAATDNKLSKLLKLIRAGKEESPISYGVGAGVNRVSFSDGKTMHFHGVEHSVQWRGNSGRIRLNGKLVSIWERLSGAVTNEQRPLILEAAREAQAAADKRTGNIQQQAANEALLDSLLPECD